MKASRKIDRITFSESPISIFSIATNLLRQVLVSLDTNAQWSPNANSNSNVAIYVFRNRRIAQFEAPSLGKLLVYEISRSPRASTLNYDSHTPRVSGTRLSSWKARSPLKDETNSTMKRKVKCSWYSLTVVPHIRHFSHRTIIFYEWRT